MFDIFLGFMDQSMTCALVRSSSTWELAYKQAIRGYHKIVTELDGGIDGASTSQPEDIRSVTNSNDEGYQNLRTDPNVGQVRLDISSKSEIASSKPWPPHKAHTKSVSAPLKSYSVPSSILSMPLYKPVMLEDYRSADCTVGQIIPLRVQILHRGLLTAYQALKDESHNESRLGEWFSRSHRFSMPHANKSTLLFMTRYSLSRLTNDLRQGALILPTTSESEDIFHGREYEYLSNAVRHEMKLSGLHTEDLLYPSDIETYLENKGQLLLNKSELQLRMRFPVTENGPRPKELTEEKLVKIDVNRLINCLIDGALCVGNGIAFPKTLVNNAIVFAAISMTDID